MSFFEDLLGGSSSGESTTTVDSETKSDVAVEVEVSPEINLVMSSPLVDNSLSPEMVQIEHQKIALSKSQLRFEKEQAIETTKVVESTGSKIVLGVTIIVLGVMLTKQRRN